jgi:hypothetical protein
MSKITSVRLKTFTYEEFSTIKDTLKEWNYEWLEFDLLHDNESDLVDVTFYLEETIISLDKFIHLLYDIGFASAYRNNNQ